MPARLRRLIGRVVLLAFVGMVAAPLAASSHVRWNDEPDCDSAGLGPRHSAPQFESGKPPVTPAHCTVCHWMRSVGTSRAHAGITLVAWLEPAGLCQIAVVRTASSELSGEGPARAPPVLA
jgi:hypothetical protein